MNIVCLDMEGVLVPEIWIAFAHASGIPELTRTTRDEPDYDKLMNWRIGILKEHGLGLREIDRFLAGLAAASEAVEVSFQWRPQLRDANDEMVLEAAVNGRAAALVTHNVPDFAKGEERFRLRVLQPGELSKELRS